MEKLKFKNEEDYTALPYTCNICGKTSSDYEGWRVNKTHTKIACETCVKEIYEEAENQRNLGV